MYKVKFMKFIPSFAKIGCLLQKSDGRNIHRDLFIDTHTHTHTCTEIT
jgi:hypothetical protein